MADSDDDMPQLSAHALAALQDFYAGQRAAEEQLQDAKQKNLDEYKPGENWNLSQFWYDDVTATRLAEAALAECGVEGRICCISVPTVYQKLRQLRKERKESQELKVLEYDERFDAYGDEFLHYDFNHPTLLPAELKGYFDVAVVDPPFLNDDCLCKIAQTVRFLTKEKVILCTGAVMSDMAKKLLQVEEQVFTPTHSNNLANEFRCYANFSSHLLQKE